MPAYVWIVNPYAQTKIKMINLIIVRFGNTYLYVDGGEVWTYVQPGTILAVTKTGIEAAVPLHRCPLRIPTFILNKDNCVFKAGLICQIGNAANKVPAHILGQTFQKDPG